MSRRHLRRSCAAYSVCSQLRKFLIQHGVPKDEVSGSCDAGVDWPCDFMLDNVRLLYGLISPESADDILRFVSTTFSSYDKMIIPGFDRSPSEAPFQCPELNIDMYQPCSVTSCSFHTENAWTLNCILYYRVLQDRENLNLNELAFLLGRGINELRSKLNRTFKVLTHTAVKETIQRENTGQLISRIDPEQVCVVCERPADQHQRGVTRSGMHYCSSTCADSKPPHAIQLEREFQLPLDQILRFCVQKFTEIKRMSDALGISSTTFSDWCRKHGVDIPKEKR